MEGVDHVHDEPPRAQPTDLPIPAWLRAGRWLGYLLLVLLVLDQALKGGLSPVFFVAATYFLTGAVLYGLSGRVVLTGHSRPRLRRYFRPCLLGLLLCIGLGLLYGWLSEVNRPP